MKRTRFIMRSNLHRKCNRKQNSSPLNLHSSSTMHGLDRAEVNGHSAQSKSCFLPRRVGLCAPASLNTITTSGVDGENWAAFLASDYQVCCAGVLRGLYVFAEARVQRKPESHVELSRSRSEIQSARNNYISIYTMQGSSASLTTLLHRILQKRPEKVGLFKCVLFSVLDWATIIHFCKFTYASANALH